MDQIDEINRALTAANQKYDQALKDKERAVRSTEHGAMLQCGEINEKTSTIEKMKTQTERLSTDSIYFKSKTTELRNQRKILRNKVDTVTAARVRALSRAGESAGLN